MKRQTFNMWLSTYKRIRSNYPALPNETLAQYFDRLSKDLEKLIK